MARPRKNLQAHIMAYKLWISGKKRMEIHKEVESMDDAPSIHTIELWISEFKKLPPLADALDRGYKWSDFGGDLPWKAADYVNTMAEYVRLRYMDNVRQAHIRNPKKVMRRIETEAEAIMRGEATHKYPTVREVMWWWRVHLSAPDLRRQEVYTIAQLIVDRSTLELLRGEPGTVEDIQSFLALKPWKSNQNLARYWTAVNQGLVKPNPRQIAFVKQNDRTEIGADRFWIDSLGKAFGMDQLLYLDMSRLILWFWSGLYTHEGGNFMPMWNDTRERYEFVGPDSPNRRSN